MKKREKLLAALVLGSLIGCNSVWAETSNTINVTKNDIPIMEDSDYTNVDVQYIVGESIGSKQSPTTGNYDRSGTITTDGKSINIKFNTLKFDITEPTDRNSYPTHVIRADQKGNNITLTGKELIIKASGLNYSGNWTATTKQASAAIHAKSAAVELNVDKTTIVVDTDGNELINGVGITADQDGKILVNGAIDITVDSGRIGVGMLTNRTGNITVAGDSNITVISDNKSNSTNFSPNVIGIFADSDNKYSDMEPAVILKGKNTTVHAEMIEGGDWSYATGIMADRDVLIDNHDMVSITAKVDSSKKNTRAEGINANANSNVKINSAVTTIKALATGTAKAYGIKLATSYSPNLVGNVYINNGLDTGITNVIANANGGNSFGIQSTEDGEVKIGGQSLTVQATTSGLMKDAYAVCNDMNTRGYVGGGNIYLNAKENIIKAESNKLGSAYALSAIDNTKGGYISVTGKSYIEAKASSESQAYAAYIKNSGLIEINKDNAAEQNVVIGRISANGTGKVVMNLNGADSSYTGYTDFADTADLDIGLQDGAVWNVKWNIKKKSSLDTLTLKDGIVDMTADKNAFSSLHANAFIGNGGTIHMDIDASTNENNSDRVYVDGVHNGNHYITLNNVGVNNEGAAGTVLVSVKDEQGTFKANDSEGTLYWNKYKLNIKDSETENYTKDWYLDKVEIITPDEKPTTSVDTVLSVNSLNYHTWRTENDKLLQRMGELRHNGEEEKGAWFRVKGSKIGYDGEFENKYTTYELGYDEVTKRTEDVVRYQGAALSYVDGNSSYNNGSGDNHGKSIGFYTTEQYSKGHYLDLVFKISNMDNDFKVFDTNGNKITGEYDNTGVSISAEYGRKNDLDHGWYIEPQAQLTLGYMGGASYETSNGISVDQSGIKSALGRIGFNIGKKIGEKGIVYAKANLLHEFGGGYDVEMRAADGSLTMSNTYNDTWFEYGVGVAMATSDNSHIYFDVERSTGSDFYKDWQWNAGMRWNF